LEEIEIPSSVIEIGEYAFDYCVNLTRIEIPSSVNVIGEGAFKYCTKLTEIEIPSSVTKIVGWTFWKCNNLKTAKVPNGCVLEENAFPKTTEIIRYRFDWKKKSEIYLNLLFYQTEICERLC